METKIKAAKISLAAGCNMVITKGSSVNPIKKLFKNGKATWFYLKLVLKQQEKMDFITNKS